MQQIVRLLEPLQNGQVAGTLTKWTINNEIYEQAFLLLDSNCTDRPVFLKAKRVIVNGHIIYSRVYVKMSKKCQMFVYSGHALGYTS